MKRLCFLIVAVCCVGGHSASGDDPSNDQASDPAVVSFRSAIAPLLRDHCLACHGPKQAEGGYRVDSYEELLKTGDSGESPITSSPELGGELLRRISCPDESERMPPDSEPLAAEQIELFRKWIAAGAKFDGDQANQSIELVIPPAQYADPPPSYQHSIPITATRFTPDGTQLITGGYHELVVWNTSDGKLARRLKNIGQRIFSLTFSHDGRTLAVGCGEPGRSGEVRLVDFESGEVKAVLARTNDVVLDLALRPGTSELAIASADSTIRIVNLDTLQEVRTIASHADWVTAVAWSDDGSRLASASRDKSAKVFDGATGELISSYLGHASAVQGVTLLAGNQQAVSVGGDNKLHRWQIQDAKKIVDIDIGGQGYKLVRHDNNLFIPCSDRRLLRLNLADNQVAQTFQGHNDWVLSASYRPPLPRDPDPKPGNDPGNDPDAKPAQLASGSFDGEVCLWNLADAAIIRQWTAKP